MKKYLSLLLIWLILVMSIPGFSQSGTSGRIRYGATLPATCSPSTGDVYFLTANPNPGLYQCPSTNTWQRSGPGSVTSIGLALPNIFSVSGSPVTTSGTITATLASQTANKAFLSPDGSSGTPTFRKIVTGDVNTANLSGNATTIGTTTGSLPSNNLAAFDASGNIKDSGIASGSFSSLSAPIHTVLLGTGTGTVGHTATGTSGLCLVSNGSGADPTYQTCGTGIPASGTYTSEKSLCSSGCDFSSLSSAIASIGSTPQTLIVADAITVGSNQTVPSTLALRFAGVGKLTISDGFTLTDLGLIFAPVRQIFFNATIGHGTVNCGNTSATNSTDGFTPQQKTYWAEWWGAIGDNVTHSADQLDAAFLALPNGSTMRLGGKFYYLEHGVTIAAKVSCSIIGNETLSGVSGNLNKPIFVYHGTAGGTVFTAINVYSCTFHGFGIYGSDGSGDVTHQAATNFFLTELAGYVPSITSRCYLTGLTLWALSTRTDWVGISINNGGGGADGNNEHHVIRECEFAGQNSLTDVTVKQQGINFGQSQVQRVVIDRNNFSSLSVGVLVGGGNFLATYNVFSNVGTPWYLNAPNDNCLIMGDDIENAGRLVNVVSTNGPFSLVFMAGKYGGIGGGTNVGSSDAQATAPIRNEGGARISFYNCNINNAGTVGQDFGPYLVGGPLAGTGAGTVEFYNCLIGTANDIGALYAPGFSTLQTRYVAGEQDLRWGGGVNDNRNLLSAAPPTVGSLRPLIELKGPAATTPADPVTLVGALGIGGLYPPNISGLTQTGTTGVATYRFSVIAVDSVGRRTAHRIDDFIGTTVGNATLTGSNYLTLLWYSVTPTPDHYEVYDINPSNSSQWRLVTNFTPTGAFTESYNIQANPSGPYVGNQPTYNEAGLINFRNLVLFPTELAIPDGTTTPNVRLSNDIVLANSGATLITNFLNGTEGQLLRIRPTDNNTTIQNNGNLNMVGGNLLLVSGIPITLIFRSSVWYRLR